jgi:hypothetical protein
LKRTEFKRAQPLRVSGKARATVKLRKCANCRSLFVPRSMTHKACGEACALIVGAAKTAKDAAKAQREAKQQTRAQLEALKTIPTLKREAQIEFNRFIRARDRAAGYACICCSKPLEWERIGGAVDAGHYRSTGSADHLRFDADNCHGQRSDCNRFGAGRSVDYRAGLIRRVGSARVEALEARNTTHKWTREGLRAIKAFYRAEWQQLEKQQ